VGHTERFRAAVVAKPVINWQSFVLTSDGDNFFVNYWFSKMPWEDPEQYAKRSPITYVGKVKTPTMLIVGESDYRTRSPRPSSSTRRSSSARSITVLVRIPGASHTINARPSNLLAQVLNTTAWFERYRVKD
jgi:acylaminoacyl-peptidase